MSRRMDREGVLRSHTQYVKNMRTWNDPRCKEDERGWVQPFTNWQGWNELNTASYALKRLMMFWRRPRLSSMVHIEDSLRSFHWHLTRSRRCDRPELPRSPQENASD
jgi:hypothetical protein